MQPLKTNDELKKMAQAAFEIENVIAAGSIWKHYKGGLYTVLTVSLMEDSLEPMVTYRSNKHGTCWTRTLKNFTEQVEMKISEHDRRVMHRPRFSRVQD